MSKQREAQKNAVITKWLGEDKFFHCQACGQIVRAVQEYGAWRFPVDIVLEADQRYGTCLCAECLQERIGADFAGEQIGEPDPIVDYSFKPQGWGALHSGE